MSNQIELAKKLLESKGYAVTKIGESEKLTEADSTNYNYKLVVTDNVSSFWNPENKKIQFFNELDDAIKFMRKTGLLSNSALIDRIIAADQKKENGRLMSTSWYDLYKGEDQMTGYTSY